MVKNNLSEEMRREIFAVLVTGQDADMSVWESRQMVVDTYKVTLTQVIEIEKEGKKANWPPLNRRH
jgi:hypothetical protein